jgi:hypothetical protein
MPSFWKVGCTKKYFTWLHSLIARTLTRDSIDAATKVPFIKDNVKLHRTTRQCDEEPYPQDDHNREPKHENRKSVHYFVVSAVDDAVGHSQDNEETGAKDQPSGNVRYRESYGTQRIEQDRGFKQILEVGSGLHVLKLVHHLQGGARSLGMDPLLLHFPNAYGQETKPDEKREQDHGKAAAHECVSG